MFGLIMDIVKEGVTYFKERQEQKHQVKLSVLKNKQRLAESEQDYNHDWEMASLESRDRFLRIVSFSLFSVPLVVTVIWPDTGAQIFTNLEKAPDWYVQTFIAINGGVWGIVELKHAAPALVNGIRKIKG
ncbi:hypothetical protein [Bowmanella yangjiangensis]|uniref:Holin of 3TMs, for gene-transfer release n=1 Tax=Bowmanella yangjiangensis TaxID=2811230 RepID=A0ABS3CTT7_9ALTE|nr:hypothetical protein [Bowmanella yangjiangensis]MBN7820533.1 hypothetical protein [Bowmanella yangjiangensis]